MADAVATFRLMRELRAAGRMLSCQPGFGWHWSPATAQFALAELEPLADLIDALRFRVLADVVPPPSDLDWN